MAAVLPSGHDPDRDRRFHRLVAARSGGARLHGLEQKNGLLESSRAFRRQDGTDAVEDGADARPHGWPRLRPRLEEEQKEFRGFLDRLRQAKDKEEFDAFMAQHRQRPSSPDASPSQG